ncbi:MAG TPA: DUF6263 family protein [Gemmataceae bacterium]|nr:DUF6263 family protein [Gemmataceae bacterium]
MLYGRRLMSILFLALMALPFAGLDLFVQAKDDKKKDDKKAAQKKDDKKKEEKKKDDKKETSKDPTKATLAWKFEKNKTFYQKMTTETNQTMKVMNNDVTQKQKQSFTFSWTPLEEKDGKWTLEQKILAVQMDIDIGGSPIKYDSTSASGNASNPLSEFFKALVGSSFKVTIDPKTLDITKIEGRDEFVKKLVNANKQMQPLLDKILSEDALRQMAQPTFSVVPKETVEKGKTWKKETTLDMGPIGKYKNEYTYTYEGKEKDLDKIKVDTKLTYMPPEKTDGVGGLPFRIKSAKLESKDAKGTVWFNRDKGRVEKTDMSLKLEGTLEIEIGGQQTKVDLTQTQKTDVETSDTNPAESKPAGK